MTVTVKYLASLAEELGKSQDTLTTAGNMTVAQVWQRLNPQHKIKTSTVCAINFSYAKLTDNVPAGSELAFFPPITGG